MGIFRKKRSKDSGKSGSSNDSIAVTESLAATSGIVQTAAGDQTEVIIETIESASISEPPPPIPATKSSSSRLSRITTKFSRVSSKKSTAQKEKNGNLSTTDPSISASASISVPSLAESVSENRDETGVALNRTATAGSNKSSSRMGIPSTKSSRSDVSDRYKLAKDPNQQIAETILILDEVQDTGVSKDASEALAAATTTPETETAEVENEEKKVNEVNYDVNPSLLYKFIEYKDWKEAIGRCEIAPQEASAWVFRYEEHDDDDIYYGEKPEKTVRWRMLPIHCAIIFGAPLGTIKAITDANPEGTTSADDRKMLPIHLCSRNLTDVKVAEYLISQNPDTLNHTDYKGRTALKVLTEYREKLGDIEDENTIKYDSIIKLMKDTMDIVDEEIEEESSDSDDDEDENNNNDANLKNPSLKERTSGSRVGNSRSRSGTKSVASKLTDDHEEEDQEIIPPTKSTLAEREARNIIPKEERVKNYLKRGEKKRRSSREIDYDTTPTVLIKLIERKMWEQAITRCVENPEEASTWMSRLQEVNDKVAGKKDVRWKILPIHSAIVLHSPVEVIEALVDAYPQGLRKGDDRKMLPLHMAFRLGASPETTAVLVDAFPDALKKKDSKGHTPLHILKAYRRKYQKERAKGVQRSKSKMDKNRKYLIRFYLGGRRYGEDDDATLAPYDSDSDSDNDSDYSGDSTVWDDGHDDDEEEDYDKLFHKNMFTEFGRLTFEGITAVPGIVRDTLSCQKRRY